MARQQQADCNQKTAAHFLYDMCVSIEAAQNATTWMAVLVDRKTSLIAIVNSINNYGEYYWQSIIDQS